MNNRKIFSFSKRLAAVIASSSLVMSVTPMSVNASTYQEIDAASIEQFVEDFTKSYEKELDNYDPDQAAKLSMTLAVNDTGRMLIGMFLGMDASWADKLTLTGDVSLNETKEYLNLDLVLNETKICSLEILIDLETQSVYMKVPELFDSTLYMPGKMLEETSPTTMINPTQILDILPTSDVIKTLITRYTSIIIDGIRETSTSSEDISVNGISQTGELHTASLNVSDTNKVVYHILSTAKDDSELHSFVKSLQTVSEDDTLYDSFVNIIDEGLEEFSDELEDENEELISFKLWNDENDKIIGREISLLDDEEKALSVKYLNPTDGENFGLLLNLNADDISLEINGNGTSIDQVVNSNFIFNYNNSDIVSIETKDLTSSIEDGTCNGTLSFKLMPGSMDEEAYSMFSSYGIDLLIDSSMDEATFTLSLLTSETSLVDLIINSSITEAKEIPDIESFGTLYDMSVETDMNAIMASMDLTTILENCISAGIPEDLIFSFIEE